MMHGTKIRAESLRLRTVGVLRVPENGPLHAWAGTCEVQTLRHAQRRINNKHFANKRVFLLVLNHV
jgi:hypothetical protein